MSAALDDHAAPREAIQAAIKRIARNYSPTVHQAAIDVLTVLETQDAQHQDRIVDEIQTQPYLQSEDEVAIRTAIRVLAIEGLVWLVDGSQRVAMTRQTAACLSEARER